MLRTTTQRAARLGFTLIEVTIALAVVTVILLATTAALQKEAENVTDLQRISYAERLVQDMFTKIEQRLDFAQGMDPRASLASSMSGGTTSGLDLDDAFGFPDQGTVVIDPGGANEERVRYTDLDPTIHALETLTRGERGTSAASHSAGAIVLWEGACAPIENQVSPAAGTFDGLTDDLRGNLYVRGDGVGFSYRRPVDPTGSGSFIDATGIKWGAQVGSTNTLDGCAALYYRPVAEIREADRAFDINQDGDQTDVFDLGTISDRAWDAVNNTITASEVDLVSPIILQERDAWGSDLDGDGFQDPMFLWTPDSGRLRMRLFVLMGDVQGREVVKRFETVLYLRNGAAE